MKKRRTTIGTCLMVLAFSVPLVLCQGELRAQEGAAEEPGAEATDDATAGVEGLEPDVPAEPAPSDEALETKSSDVAPTTPLLTTGSSKTRTEDSWKDIVVIPRKTFLKRGRIELKPIFSMTINDNLIQHFAVGGEVNYFLTDILSIGVSGQYYFKNVLDSEFYTRYHLGRVPSLNKYIYSAGAHFSYVPVYGKFAIFNNQIIHFEGFVSGGFGITGTEVIPRDYRNEPFTNAASLTFLLPELGARFFLTKWMAVHFSYRNYLVLDKFESSPRDDREADIAKEKADSRLITNMMFNMGVSFFFPMDFKYTTFR